ncbi:hypothetical protein FIBSPDRAFT_339362 [Athelia psychrophila]|uniref:Uncharacterized protein n=1 Tax=Athelia psychrophila TaxID=1759441 RepID=A0A167W8C5_9AGAM|nr:hypothetical protein FIBSPDRAFT_339362 [Fibularhizoctonia sp. CBS 109695]
MLDREPLSSWASILFLDFPCALVHSIQTWDLYMVSSLCNWTRERRIPVNVKALRVQAVTSMKGLRMWHYSCTNESMTPLTFLAVNFGLYPPCTRIRTRCPHVYSRSASAST